MRTISDVQFNALSRTRTHVDVTTSMLLVSVGNSRPAEGGFEAPVRGERERAVPWLLVGVLSPVKLTTSR